MFNQNRALPMLALVVSACLGQSLFAQSRIDGKHDPMLDWPMMTDPLIVEPQTVKEFDSRAIDIWIEALARPDIDTRRLAAQAIVKAHADGFPGLEKTIPALTQLAGNPKNHRYILINASQALIALDASQAGPQLLELNRTGDQDLVILTDPALAAWRVPQAPALWLARMNDANTARIIRESSIRQLGAVEHKAGFFDLLNLACDTKADSGLRLLAARAAVRCRAVQPTLKQASELASGSIVDRHVAAVILANQSDADSVALLVRLAQDPEPAVCAEALECLLVTRPVAVAGCVEKVLTSPDARVRLLGARSLFAQNAPNLIVRLSALLDDHNPEVRRYVRDQLLDKATRPELLDDVISVSVKALGSDAWRQQEQAAIILGRLKHKPSVDRLIELIDSPRYEVGIASVVALRWIGDYAVAGRLFEISQRLDKGMPKPQEPAPAAQPAAAAPARGNARAARPAPAAPAKTPQQIEEEKQALAVATNNWHRDKDRIQTQLFHFFKEANYREAEPLFRKYIPKKSTSFTTARGAAIWSLGHFYADKADPQLAGAFLGRANDNNPMDPEASIVQRFSVISIGRMKSKGSVRGLSGVIKFFSGSGEVAIAARWAQQQISGSSDPEPPAPTSRVTGWFLEPLPPDPKPVAPTPSE
jgi:HEAT repeat protein